MHERCKTSSKVRKNSTISTSVESVFLDKTTLNESGNSPILLQTLKTACLSYVNNLVNYRNQTMTVGELNELKGKLIKQCNEHLTGYIGAESSSIEIAMDRVVNDELNSVINEPDMHN